MIFTVHRWQNSKGRVIWHGHTNYCFGWDSLLNANVCVCGKYIRVERAELFLDLKYFWKKAVQTVTLQWIQRHSHVLFPLRGSRLLAQKTHRTVWNHNFTLPATDFIFLSCFHTIGSHQRELPFMTKKCPSAGISRREENKGNHAWFITYYIVDMHSHHGGLYAILLYHLEPEVHLFWVNLQFFLFHCWE